MRTGDIGCFFSDENPIGPRVIQADAVELFHLYLDTTFGDDDRIITSDIPDRDGILDSIRDFLGTGR